MRIRASLVAAACLLSSAACQKTTLPAVKPNGLALQLSSATVSADDGTLTVTAQAFQDGVALLDQPIAFSITGADAAAGGTVSTSSTSGQASFTFSGLTVAGDSQVVVQTGTAPTQISRSAPLTVVAGQPTALTLTDVTNPPAIAGSATNFTLSGTDGHGNAIASPGAFLTTDAPGGAANGLRLEGITKAGTWTAYAYAGSVSTSTTFMVVHAAPAVTLASLAAFQVEAGQPLSITCSQTDAFGNDTATAFVAGDVTTTDAGATVGSPAGGTFSIANLVDKGTFTATCSRGAISSLAQSFTVVDTTGPGATAALTAASGPQGVTGDFAYAPGENVTLHVDASDIVGVSKTTLSVIGPGTVNGSSSYELVEPTSTRTASRDFTVAISTLARTFTTIEVVAQVSDTTGNTSAPQTFTLHVDPAAGLDTPPGVLARTWFEPKTPGTEAVAIASSSGTLYVKRANAGGGPDDDIVRIATTGTAFTIAASDFVPGADAAGIGMVDTPAPFGGFQLFHTEFDSGASTTDILALGTASSFASSGFGAGDLTFGNVGGTDRLFTIFYGGGISTIFSVDAARTLAPFCNASSGDGAVDAALTYDGTNGLYALSSLGEVDAVDMNGARTLKVTFANGGTDLAVGSGELLVAGAGARNVLRATTAGVTQTPLGTNFDDPVGLAVGPSGELYVLERGDAVSGIWRVIKVMGY